jgi:protein-disulfide isomerase
VAIAVSSGGGGGTKAPARKAGESVAGQTAAASLLSGIPQKGISLGSPKAPVTLVEFADLQCPFCREYTLGVLPTLVQRYVRTGKVRMEFRNLSFIGPDSRTAGLWAAAAGEQNRLWGFIDLMYDNQQTENTGYVTDSFLRRIAGAVPGLNVARAAAGASGASASAQLAAANTLASRYRVDSTPSFLVGRTGGGLTLLDSNALSLSEFTGPLDKLLGQ